MFISLEVNNMMTTWEQKGSIIVSSVTVPNSDHKMPMIHSFHISPLEAKHALRDATNNLPPSLIKEIQIKPATLTFEFERVIV